MGWLALGSLPPSPAQRKAPRKWRRVVLTRGASLHRITAAKKGTSRHWLPIEPWTVGASGPGVR